MRYVLYVLLVTVLGMVLLNNTSEGRKIKHRMHAVGESNAQQYRPD